MCIFHPTTELGRSVLIGVTIKNYLRYNINLLKRSQNYLLPLLSDYWTMIWKNIDNRTPNKIFNLINY